MFIGQTRFSLYVPGSAAWRVTKGAEAPEGYREYLYDEERLDQRTNVFLNHTVPTLQKAAGKVKADFEVIHVVSFSESLPKKYKEQLKQAAENYPILHLEELPDGNNAGKAVGSLIRERIKPGDTFGRYRLDDDDILSANYFSLVKKYVKPEYAGMVVSLPLGVEAILKNQVFFNPRLAHVPMNSMGLLSICQLQEDGKIKQPKGGPHDKSDRYAPVILEGRGIGYLRAVHLGQDNVMRYSEASALDNLLENLGKFPPLNSMDIVEENFPTVAASHGTIIDIDRCVGSGIAIGLQNLQSGVGVRITGNGANNAKPEEIAVTYLFADGGGNIVPDYRKIPGLAASPNRKIGFFQYVPTNGKFNSQAGIYVPDDIKIKALRILPLTEKGSETWINSVEILGEPNAIEGNLEEFVQELEASQRDLKKRLVATVINNRELLYSYSERFLGTRRARKARRLAQRLLRKLRS